MAKKVEKDLTWIKYNKLIRKEMNGMKEQILAVQRMQDYIGAHLKEKNYIS